MHGGLRNRKTKVRFLGGVLMFGLFKKKRRNISSLLFWELHSCRSRHQKSIGAEHECGGLSITSLYNKVYGDSILTHRMLDRLNETMRGHYER